MTELLSVQDLHVTYRGGVEAVRGVSLGIARGERLALVGESGSGKTTIGRAILGLHPTAVRVRGSINVDGTELVGLSQRRLRRWRGTRIALVPQDPLAALNPLQRIGPQVAEVLRVHGLATGEETRRRTLEALRRAGLDDAEQRVRAYPHELSGGQRQRVLIAMALVAEPDLIVADEPTSALDVTVQRRILDHLDLLVREAGASLLLITHDLGVATDRTDRVVVLRDGQVVEQLASDGLHTSAVEPYTKALAVAAPTLSSRVLVRPAVETSEAQPLLQAVGLRKVFPGRNGAGDVVAVDDVDLTLRPGQSLGLVGESGSGKTTTARILLGLTGHDGGVVRVSGRAWADATTRAGRRVLYRIVQPVFQDPYSSLDPSHSVAGSIAEPLRYLSDLSRRARSERVLELLDAVHLPRNVSRRKPYELSGGQLQRVAIARALAVRPGVLVCDEPVSSLDVSIQDQILRLLAELREQSDLAYLFISHDLAVVHQICNEVIVMRDGQVVERGPTAEVFTNPATEYTKEFLASIPGGVAASVHTQ